MSHANLLSPPSSIPPKTALSLSQKAPLILAASPTSSLPWPLSLLFSRESPESWTIHENLFLSSLRTGDDKSARLTLDRMTTRFGADNERIIALRGIYEEALANTPAELEKVFQGYEKILREDPTNLSIRKRRVAILKSLGRPADAITALTVLLENSPTDVEAWAELSELYASQGLWAQAIYSLEEVLLVMPNAWSAHAQLATLYYLSTPSNITTLSLSLRYFCRSIELNDTYLRGYYGLKLVSQKLLPLLSDSTSLKRNNDEEEAGPPPKLATVKKLEELATSKLAEIVRQYNAGKTGWTGLDEAEVIAAKALLDHGGIER
ncbi:hypothetical protein K504DRAFT_377074 [Pleomassaria siparia CBS 279.74]|uniref:ER membrane protein complex subunit 2 n=1 Tax=Pleomassaria siparia CBS 279.74 TaxID=1314801 RepID=A0A6G1KCX4_9PLEO|nr:hypothetical protein K504DRAFT_377074 [Pleomassaria siparia CBS 279.74]